MMGYQILFFIRVNKLLRTSLGAGWLLTGFERCCGRQQALLFPDIDYAQWIAHPQQPQHLRHDNDMLPHL
jgi:hypothetical protein